MTTYVDVGVERIHSYLSRSRHLWGRRGASESLVRLTTLPDSATKLAENQRQALAVALLLADPQFSGHVRLNGEGLDIDGVVSLVSEDHELSLLAGHSLALAMRREQPAITVSVSWVTVEGETYAEQLTREKEEQAWQRVRYFPAPFEFPLVRPCDECHVSPASHATSPRFEDEPNEELRLCGDCFARLEHEERRQTTVVRWHHPPDQPNRFVSEWQLRDHFREKHPGEEWRATRHLKELASLVRPALSARTAETEDGIKQRRRRTTRDNHVALIYADGNGFGDLFDRLRLEAARSRTTDTLRRVSKRVKQAMWESLVAATEAIHFEGELVLPVVPHIFGGDDLLASLPAERAWEFGETLLNGMRARLASDRELQPILERSPVSFSAGILISKASYPFGNQAELVQSLMKLAKEEVKGGDWSLTWLDVTHDGPDARHGVWTLDQLADRRAAVDFTSSGLSGSSAGVLHRVISDPDLAAARQKLAHLASRMPDTRTLLDRLGITHPLSADDVVVVKDTISIGRWWR